jgi:hypothetical protein
MDLGSNKPLMEMNTRDVPGAKGGRYKADSLTAICEPIVWKMSHNPMGLHGLLQR